MTGLLHEKEFSRKSFVKGGGGLVVGFSMLGMGISRTANAAPGSSPDASNGPYDQYQVDSWITINPDNTASIKSGGILQGTGSDTGLLMIAGEELNMDMSQLEFVMADTNVTPNSGKHSASNTIKNGGPGVRAAAAAAYQALLGIASSQLGVPVSQLTVSEGVVSGGGKSVTYGQLLGGKLFDVTMPASWNMNPTVPSNSTTATGTFSGGIQPGQSPAKPVSQYTLVGTNVPRIDVPAIVSGAMTYIQNIHVPGMLHGRIVRPRGQALFGFGAPIVSIDESSIAHIPGVQIVRRNNFLGVVAPREYDAIQAAALLKVIWADPPAALPGDGNEFSGMRALDTAGKTVTSVNDLGGYGANFGNVDAAFASAAHVVSGTFGWATNCHTPIGPQCAVADVTPQGARIYSGTQGAYQTRPQVALVLGLPENLVRITAVAMGGCFGDGCQYFDTAQAAAIMSQVVGAPVRVQLMRWDEIGWGQVSPSSLIDIRAGIDASGHLVALDYTHFYPQYRSDNVQTNAELSGVPLPTTASSISGNYWPGPMYNLPNSRYLLKSIPLQNNWFKTYWMRAGHSPHGAFAMEQVVDDLARLSNMDPVAFRIQNVNQGNNWTGAGQSHDQLLAVLNAVAQAANWQPKVPASNLSSGDMVTGRGVAWSNIDSPKTYAQTAAIADVIVNKKTGKITVKHVWQAASAGLGVSIGGIENQIVGGVTQIVSRVLTERYAYTKTHVTSWDFLTYPILRFRDAPDVTPIVIQWSQNPYTGGVGEPVAVAAAAAVANAFHDATGVRLTTTPLTPPRVKAALKAAGIA
jgi:CO/xanthine dehydrogenase Mo-binding subunit